MTTFAVITVTPPVSYLVLFLIFSPLYWLAYDIYRDWNKAKWYRGMAKGWREPRKFVKSRARFR